MKKHLVTAILMTIATTILLGIVYPLVVTALAQVMFHDKANGQTVGSHIIGQPFTGPGFFHSRPSAAGNGYDAANSSGSNLGPTNKQLIDRVHGDVDKAHAENPALAVPIDLVTTSGSGLDPHISPQAAEFQVPRVARERNLPEAQVRALVAKFTEQRQLGVLGEERVNVLELNLALADTTH